MNLLIVTITGLMLLNCNTEKQTKNSAANTDSTQVNENTTKPDIPDSLPPNTAQVVLELSGNQPTSADSLKVTQGFIKQFMQSGSSTPALTQGEQITLKISSRKLRNSLLQNWKYDATPNLEAIIKYAPTIALSSEKSNQKVWSLIQINAYQ